MKIKTIDISGEGYVRCKSGFYHSLDVMSQNSIFHFVPGLNQLQGEIDSGVWAISYLLSMYDVCADDFNLFMSPCTIINDAEKALKDLLPYTCYMDESYPLFARDKSVHQLVDDACAGGMVQQSPHEIQERFALSADRFERSLGTIGNERFKAMAAIGYCYGKQVFCFPWLSKRRFESFHSNLTYPIDMLSELGKVVILPIGN